MIKWEVLKLLENRLLFLEINTKKMKCYNNKSFNVTVWKDKQGDAPYNTTQLVCHLSIVIFLQQINFLKHFILFIRVMSFCCCTVLTLLLRISFTLYILLIVYSLVIILVTFFANCWCYYNSGRLTKFSLRNFPNFVFTILASDSD